MQPASPVLRVPRWVWLLVGGLGAALLLCALVGAAALWGARGLIGDPLGGGTREDLSRAEIASIARITIPPEASGVSALMGGFQDRYIFVRLEIPAAALATMAANPHWPQLALGVPAPFQPSLEPERAWWTPGDAASSAAGTSFVAGVSQAVLVDTSDPQRLVVYVQTFET